MPWSRLKASSICGLLWICGLLLFLRLDLDLTGSGWGDCSCGRSMKGLSLLMSSSGTLSFESVKICILSSELVPSSSIELYREKPTFFLPLRFLRGVGIESSTASVREGKRTRAVESTRFLGTAFFRGMLTGVGKADAPVACA